VAGGRLEAAAGAGRWAGTVTLSNQPSHGSRAACPSEEKGDRGTPEASGARTHRQAGTWQLQAAVQGGAAVGNGKLCQRPEVRRVGRSPVGRRGQASF